MNMAPNEAINRVARSQEIIEFATTPGRAFLLIAQLQLALRHPENHGTSAEFARQIIGNLADAIARVTKTPEVILLVAQGYHPEFDLAEPEDGEFFGERPRQEQRLNLHLDLTEDVNTEEIGRALAMLAKQTTNPEETWQRWQEALAVIKIEPTFPA